MVRNIKEKHKMKELVISIVVAIIFISTTFAQDGTIEKYPDARREESSSSAVAQINEEKTLQMDVLQQSQGGKITVEISGINKTEGRLAIGLYNKSDGFPEINKAYNGVSLKITEKNINHIFSDIPSGDYAVAVFHDINGNNKLDKNFIGIPKEGYAFSKNARGTFGPPHFDKAKFKLDRSYTAKIKIKY